MLMCTNGNCLCCCTYLLRRLWNNVKRNILMSICQYMWLRDCPSRIWPIKMVQWLQSSSLSPLGRGLG